MRLHCHIFVKSCFLTLKGSAHWQRLRRIKRGCRRCLFFLKEIIEFRHLCWRLPRQTHAGRSSEHGWQEEREGSRQRPAWERFFPQSCLWYCSPWRIKRNPVHVIASGTLYQRLPFNLWIGISAVPSRGDSVVQLLLVYLYKAVIIHAACRYWASEKRLDSANHTLSGSAHTSRPKIRKQRRYLI